VRVLPFFPPSSLEPFVRMADRPFSTISGDTPYAVANFPLPSTSDDDIREPRAPYMASSSVPLTSDSPRESYMNTTPNGSGALLANKHESYAEHPILPTTSPKSKRRSVVLVVLLLVALAAIIVAVIVPVYFTVIKPKLNQSNKSNSSGGGGGSSPKSGSPGGGGSTPSPGSPNVITGGDGSTVNATDGTTFIYHNSFGGFCKCFTDFIFCPTGNC
jgi:glucan 1,3-beta-glucosidase